MDGSTWPAQRTAVLVIHGIGSQFPFETLDMFTRPLVDELDRRNPGKIKLEHRVATRDNIGIKGWKENSIRITRSESTTPIDIYEYYWANLSENLVTLKDLQKWVSQVVAGAKEFYNENKHLGEACKDDSILFNKHGAMRGKAYKLTLLAAFGLIPLYVVAWRVLFMVATMFPYIRWIAKPLADLYYRKVTDKFTNYAGDVAVYNSLDPKSTFYKIRTEILEGAVSALRHLVEMKENVATDSPALGKSPYYGRIIVAGHSLGSQIAFDAINRLTRMISLGEITGVAPKGDYIDSQGNPQPFRSGTTTLSNIRETLCGLVTFGSPLDKIAFFLRQQAPNDQYLRCQILENYHSFKQGPWNAKNDPKVKHKLPSPFTKIFNEIRWYNIYDLKDPVSGYLHFYDKVENKHMEYESNIKISKVRHEEYWKHPYMFEKIIDDFIIPVEPPKHVETESG
ncbi:MAG: hypothetical protein KAV42_02250 [Candidatus Krumholzibacteria bacterium]|nr:hypothetical protein [Candidatus Krumholzibacteria bacterium]